MFIMKIRKSLKTTAARFFLMAVTLTVLGGYGVSSVLMRMFGKSVDGIVMVNGVSIPASVFKHAAYEEEQKINNLRQRYGAKADLYMKLMGMETDVEKITLNQLVTEELVNQYGNSFALTLADQYVQEKLANPQFIVNEIGHMLPASVFTQDGKINVYALTQFIAMPEMEGIRLQLTEKIRHQFALLIAQSATYIPGFLAKDLYINKHVAKKFNVQKFDINHFRHQANIEDVTKEDLRNFYEQKSHKDGWYWIAEQRFGTAWEFSATDFGISVSDSEIADYYAKNKTARYVEKPAQFKVREIIFNKAKEMGMEGLRKEAEKAYARLMENPDYFATIAKEVSQSEETAADGGLVNYFPRGTKDKEYEKAMVRLKNNGDISSIVKTEHGFAIIQRIDRKEPLFSSLEKVKDAIITSLTEQKFRRTFAKEADKVVKERNQDALVAFVHDHHGHKKSVGPVEKNNENDFQRIFSLRNDGDMTVFIENNKGIILQLTEKHAKHLPSFSSMIDKVSHDYREERATVLLEKAVRKAQQLAHAQGGLVQIDGSKIETTSWIDPENKDQFQKLMEEGYPEDFMTMTTLGQIDSEITKKGATLIELIELNSKDLGGYSDAILRSEGESYQTIHNLFTSACLASLFRTATIRINEELIHGKDKLL